MPRRLLAFALGLVVCAGVLVPAAPVAAATAVAFSAVVPVPVSASTTAGVTYDMTAATTIYAQPGSAPAAAIANQFASHLRGPTGFPLPVNTAVSSPSDGIALLLSGAPGTVGA